MAREPITWRNITTVSGDSAGSTLRGSADAVTAGFDSLSKILGQFQEGRQKAFDYQQDDTAATFQDRLAQARSTEEFAALRESDEMRALYSQLTPDRRDEIRGAENDWEQKLISQLGLREQRADSEFDRSNRDAYAQELLGAVGGDQGSVARLAGLRSDGASAVKEGWDMFTSGQGEQRAQDQNTRAWNDDRRADDANTRGWASLALDQARDSRAAQVHEENMRVVQGSRRLDTLATDEFMRRLDPETQGGMTPEEEDAAFVAQLYQAGFTPAEAHAARDLVSANLESRFQLNPETQDRLDTTLNNIDQTYFKNNPYAVAEKNGELSSPDDVAAEIAGEFASSNSRILEGSPGATAEIMAHLARIQRTGVEVVHRGERVLVDQLTPNQLRNIMRSVEPNEWLKFGEISVYDAARYYIEQNPEIIGELVDYKTGVQLRNQATVQAEQQLKDALGGRR